MRSHSALCPLQGRANRAKLSSNSWSVPNTKVLRPFHSPEQFAWQPEWIAPVPLSKGHQSARWSDSDWAPIGQLQLYYDWESVVITCLLFRWKTFDGTITSHKHHGNAKEDLRQNGTVERSPFGLNGPPHDLDRNEELQSECETHT